MSASPSATERLHATSVARDGRAVLISGPSGAGKSDLALRLIDRGFTLVSDDQTILELADGRLLASAPSNISGKLEIRGIGIVDMTYVDAVPVSLLVVLTNEINRLPNDENSVREVLGVALPSVSVDPVTASAAAKVVIALDRMGLR